MKVSKERLVNCLKLAIPGIETGKSTLQGGDTFIFHNNTLFTYNNFIAVSIPLELSGLGDVEGVIKADEFFKVVSKLPSDEIDFDTSKEDVWVLKSGRATVEMVLLKYEYQNILDTITTDGEWVDVDDEFLTGIKVVRMVNKSKFAGVCFDTNNVYSTNGYQLNSYTYSNINLPLCWIEEDACNELLKLNNIIAVQIGDTWVHFKLNNGSIFSVKRLLIKYPIDNIKRILEEQSKLKDDSLKFMFPKDIFTSIDRATSFSTQYVDFNQVMLCLKKEGIEVSAERETGRFKEIVVWDEPIKEDFEPISFSVDVDMIKYISTKTNEFYLISDETTSRYKMLFMTDKSKHILMTFERN